MFLANLLMKFCIGGENLDTKLQVLPLPKTFRVYVYNNVRYIHSCESNYDNSLRSSARDTKLSKLRIITCNYSYKERLEINYRNISFAVGFSRRSSCINAYIMIARVLRGLKEIVYLSLLQNKNFLRLRDTAERTSVSSAL